MCLMTKLLIFYLVLQSNRFEWKKQVPALSQPSAAYFISSPLQLASPISLNFVFAASTFSTSILCSKPSSSFYSSSSSPPPEPGSVPSPEIYLPARRWSMSCSRFWREEGCPMKTIFPLVSTMIA